MSNSVRFIIAYNKIDGCLRNIYNYSPSMSFSELVRRCSPKNYIVRSFETLLIDYSRLRNAIVHKSTDEMIIAEPHTEVTEKIEHIAKLICTPPSAISKFHDKKVTIIEGNTKLNNAIKLIRESKFSNIPVYSNNKLNGIINNKIIVNKIADQLVNNNSIDHYLKNETAAGVLDNNYFNTYYKLCNKKVTVEDVLESFYQNRKLLAVLITEHGLKTEKPICIITAYDLTEINSIIDNYQD